MLIFGRRGLTKLSADRVKKLLYTLVKSYWRWYFWALRSEWSKKVAKNDHFAGWWHKWLKNTFLVEGG